MKITLRKKNLKDGKSSLYLDYYTGSTNGNIVRKTKTLEGFRLYTEPKDKRQKEHNKNTLELAEKIVIQKQNEINHNSHGFINNESSNANFIEFFYQLSIRKDNVDNKANWKSVHKFLIQYAGSNVSFSRIDRNFIEGFKFFLEKKAFKKNGESLAINSQSSYFKKFKASLKEAYSNGYMQKHFGDEVSGIKEEETYREYLTKEEFEKLAKTPLKPEVLKKAFMFSCLTGLRFSDVQKLIWEEVEEYQTGKFKIKFRQKKTKGVQYIPLHKQAIEIIGERRNSEECVFKNLQYNNVKIKDWAKKAKIEKNISFHVSRHTAATLLMTYGVDLYVIKEILGHKDIHTTQIYTKIVNQRKDEAIDKLPIFDI